MMPRTLLKRVHLVATIWFIACVGYLLAMAFHQAGLKWWLIFSLSGHSALGLILLVSLYLFAFYRGADRARYGEAEHPVTSSDYYLVFYVSAPLLGGLAAVLSTANAPNVGRTLSAVAMGTLATTFVVWIVIDPVAGMIESLLPASRRHRAQRIGGMAQAHSLSQD